jgi:copper(I)-binding protein
VFPVIWLQARKDSNVRLQNRRVVGATLLAFAAALVLAGCGAGQITQTATQEPAINGANAQVGTLYIRDAALQFPPSGPAYKAGSSAALTLTIINAGQQDDELVGVTSDAASGAVIQGSKLVVAGNSLVISPPAAGPDTVSGTSSPSSSAPATTSSSPAASTSPPTSASPTSPSSTSSSPATTSSAATPVTVGHGSIILQKLKQPIYPGQTIKVTFIFRNAGPVPVDLPIAAPSQPQPGEIHTEAARTVTSSSGH